MLTGCGSEEIAVQALHKGAIDYIPKDSFSKDSIWGLIKAALETWKRKRAEEGLRRKNDDCGDMACCKKTRTGTRMHLHPFTHAVFACQ